MTTLTPEGQRLHQTLRQAGVVRPTSPVPIHALNTAAASLRLPLEGDASLREALGQIACLSPEPDNKAWTTEPWGNPANYQAYDDNGSPQEVVPDCDNKADREAFGYERGLHRAAVIARAALGPPVYFSHAHALARPQPEAKGPVAAGVIGEIAAERRRQIEAESWTPEHDDEHVEGQIALAAAAYAVAATGTPLTWADPLWPWSRDSWKPSAPRRMLVKSGALIVAEIERLDRASGASTTPPAEAKTPDAGVGEPRERWGIEETADAIWVGPMRPNSVKVDRVVFWKSTEGVTEKAKRLNMDDALLVVRGVNAALTPTGSAGEDDTGVREAKESLTFSSQHHRDEIARRVANDDDGETLARVQSDASLLHAALGTGSAKGFMPETVAGIRAACATRAPQPPKAETPAGVGRLLQIAQAAISQAALAEDEVYRRDGLQRIGSQICGHLMAAGLGTDPAALSAAPAARPGDGVEDAADKLANAALELAEYASYAEIVGAIRHNRSAIRTWCDAVFQAHKEYCALDAARPAAAPAAEGGRA